MYCQIGTLFPLTLGEGGRVSQSEIHSSPWTLRPSRQTVAQLSRAVKPRTAPRKKAAQYVQERRTGPYSDRDILSPLHSKTIYIIKLLYFRFFNKYSLILNFLYLKTSQHSQFSHWSP